MKNTFDTVWKKILQHKLVAIFLLIIIFFLLELATYKYDQHDSIIVQFYKKTSFEPTLEKAKNFYRTYDTSMQTDEYVMLMWLWPEYAVGIERVFASDPFYHVYSNELRMENITIDRRVDTKEELAEFTDFFGFDEFLYNFENVSRDIFTDPSDDFVLKALYCDVSGYDDFDYDLLGTVRDGQGGYGDTHYLLSLIFLERLGCVSDEDVEVDKKSVIDNIVMAQKNDTEFSDLFAERVVMLYWADRGDLVRMSWIKMIANNIQSDGGWQDIGNEVSDAHATGLSALALKYFIEGDNFRNLLIQ